MQALGLHFQPHRVCFDRISRAYSTSFSLFWHNFQSIFGFKPKFTVRKRSSLLTTYSSQHNLAVIVHHAVVIATASCNNYITLHLNAASLLAPTNVHHKDYCSPNKMHIAASLSYSQYNCGLSVHPRRTFCSHSSQLPGYSRLTKKVLWLFARAFVDTSSQRISSKHIFADEKARSCFVPLPSRKMPRSSRIKASWINYTWCRL